MLLHGVGSRLELRVHAAARCCLGGDRGSSGVEENRSTTRMVPLQSGHLGRVTDGLGSPVSSSALVRSAELPSRLKQRGSSLARWRLARKPKLRMRTKPRGSRWSRKRRRNSSAGRLMTRLRLLCAESRQRKLTWPSAKETSLLFAMPTRWVYAPR
jgi:hypothetical protein